MRICVNCNEPFSGRSDKKFCSDYCRNQHNFSKSRYAEPDIREIHKIMRNNHRILSKLEEAGCKEVDVSTLIGIGFCPDVVTGYNIENESFILYDCSYKVVEGRIVFCKNDKEV